MTSNYPYFYPFWYRSALKRQAVCCASASVLLPCVMPLPSHWVLGHRITATLVKYSGVASCPRSQTPYRTGFFDSIPVLKDVAEISASLASFGK